MSVAFVTGSSAIAGASAVTSFNGGVAYTAIGGASSVLVVSASWSADPGAITTFTWNGVAITQLGTTFGSAGHGFIAFFYLLNPAAGANSLHVVWTNSVNCTFCAGEFSGINVTTPLANLTTNSGTSATSSVTIPTTAGDAVMQSSTAEFSNRSGQNQTLIADGSDGTSAYITQYGLAGGSSVTASVTTFGSVAWSAAGVDIQAAGGGAVRTPTLTLMGCG
jgi:hypothetical protein